MKNIDEATLIDLAVNSNDQRAFAELVNRHQSKLRYSLRQLCNFDEALADDLAQESFIKAFKQLHKFKQQSQFSSWLYRIGYNTFLEFVRKKKLDTVELDENFDRSNEQSFYSSEINEAEQEEQQSGLQKKLAELLATLEPERRSVLHLLLHRQFTQQEIATTMSIPLGTVKTHINRGRVALQTGLQEWQPQT
ncbi:MAG TPA: RNA polymerase subunit sigma-24 [Gammaproteobacteria bacterium]|jgi:RNA polymerase sigma factor (sigma-70 family)|nr:RNA polymerase subunit sigma-24 [Gammaproteobacteria bacterium]